jgi:hypothetical protein
MPPGTTAKVTVLSSLGTIDERIDHALRQKLEAMNEVLKDPTLARLSRITIDPAAPAFTEPELGALLGHLRAEGASGAV